MKAKLKAKYKQLQAQVIQCLSEKIAASRYTSKYVNYNAIKISVDDFVELAFIDEKLVLIDSDGLHYNISVISINRLIELI